MWMRASVSVLQNFIFGNFIVYLKYKLQINNKILLFILLFFLKHALFFFAHIPASMKVGVNVVEVSRILRALIIFFYHY